MSKTVDERVVSMQFDNRQFEKNVSTTMSTLDKLKQSLNLTGAAKAFENIDSASKKVNFSGLSGAVEGVGLKFSALFTIADQTLRNITNSVERTAKKIVSAFTIDPIKTGFQEYETQINAVQTILANTESKGTTLQQVNSALDTLNTYADKTIYNFTEMTRNIGTFTAAGVDLDTSVSAIQGIANLAAVSGSTSQQASTAMYQLSQALSSGTVKLMDWNSVVNAGMGGQVFQDALKQTARIHGVAIDSMIEEQGSFRETLQEGWLTADILTETLNQFTMAAEEGSEEWETYKKSLMDKGYTEEQALSILKMANTATDAATKVKTFTQLWDTLKESVQSGWTQSWEIVIGDFEEAKGFLTDISNRLGEMIGASADARNEMLSGGLASGWKQLLNAGIADEEGYKETFKSIAKEHNVSIDDMIKAEKELDDSLTDSEAFQKALKKGLTEGTISSDMLSESVHKMAEKMSNMSSEELKAAGYTADHVKQIKELSDGLKDGSISMDEFTKKIMRTSGRENIIQALWNAFDGLMSVIKPVQEAFREIFPPITGEQLYSFTQTLVKLTEKLTISSDTAEKLKRTFKGVFALLDIGVKIIKALFGGFSDLISYISPAGGSILDFTAKIGDFLVKLNEGVETSDIFNKAIKKVGDFLRLVVNNIKSFGASISEAFGSVGDTAKRRFEPLTVIGKLLEKIFTGIGNIINKISPTVMNFASAVGDALKALMDRVTNTIKNADYNTVFDALNVGILSGFGIFIAKFIKSGGGFAEFLKSLKDIFGGFIKDTGGFIKSIKNVLDGVSDALGAFTKSLQAKALKDIAIAIAILAGSLFVLSFIDSTKLAVSLGIITGLFIDLFGAMAIFDKLSSGKNKGIKNIIKMAGTMITLSSALLILSVAMKIMSTMSWQEMAIGLISVGVSLGVLIGAIKLLSMIKDADIKKFAKSIKTMSSALVVLAVALKIMSTMSWQEMGIALISMVAGLGALVGTVALLNLIKDSDIIKASKAIMKLSFALIILAVSLKIMATMSWIDIARGLTVMVSGLGALVAALHLLPKEDTFIKAIAMQNLAKSILILGLAIKLMSTMSWQEIVRGLTSMSVGLVAMVIAVNKLPKDTALRVAGMIGFAAAILVLGIALKSMGKMSWEETARSLITLAGAFIIIGVAAHVLGPLVPVILFLGASIALIGAGCLAAGIGVLALGAGLAALSAALSLSGGAIVLFVSSLIGLIPYLIEQIGVGIILLCKYIADSSDAICDAVTVIIIAVVDAIVISVPYLVEGVLKLVTSLLQSLASHAPVIVGYLFDFLIGLINALAEKMPDLVKAGVKLVLSLFVGVVEALKEIDAGTLVEGLVAVGMLAALVISLAAIAALTPAAMIGVVGLGVVISELAIVLAAIGALAQIPGLDWLISEGGKFMQTVGTAIGRFLGGIVGGFATGMSAALPQIGSDLSAFMTNAMPFIYGVKLIDSAALEGVKSLVGVILAITAANVIEGLTSWITGGSSLVTFGEEISEFAPYIKQYADTVKGIDVSAVEASATAAKCLSELAKNLPNSGGLAGWFAGENDIGTFGEQLVPFGEGMKAYSDSITGFNAEAVIASANAAQAISDMASTLPNEGGVAAWFAGDNSIAVFADQLVDLGAGLKSYSDAIVGFDAEAVIASANAAKALADMTSYIPNEGGLVAWFAGDNSIATFAGDLVLLGLGLKSYSDSISGFNAEAVIASANAAKSIAEMASYIPNEGGLVAWFKGENSIASFGSQLPLLGMGLLGFSLSVTGIVPENIISAANAAKALAEMTDVIPKEGGIKAWFTGETSIANFASNLPSLGKGLKGFSDSVAGIVPENVTAAASAAKNLAIMADTTPKNTDKIISFGENLKEFGSKLKLYFDGIADVGINSITVSSFAIKSIKSSTEGLDPSLIKSASEAIDQLIKTIKNASGIKKDSVTGFEDALKNLSKNSVKSIIEAFKNENSNLEKAGEKAIKNVIEGMKNKKSDISDAGKALAKACAKSIDDSDNSFVTAGKNLVKGFANGIKNNKYLASNAGSALGRAALSAAKKALDENSPSKEMYKVGDFAGLGFVNALYDNAKDAYSAGKNIGDSAKVGLSKAISKIKDAVNTDIDSQPTIRPVLDLSDVTSGASIISGLFDTPSIGVKSNLSAISSMMSERNQNGVDTEIVSAINKLRNDLGNIKGNTYNVNGITYDDGSNIANAVETLVRASVMERRM